MALQHSPRKNRNESVSSDMSEKEKGNSDNIAARQKRKRAGSHEDELNSFMTTMKKMMADLSSQQEKKFDIFHTKFDILHTSMQEIKEQNCEIRTSIDFISGQYDEMVKKIDILENERKNHLAYIQSLEHKVENFEKGLKSSSLEIRNIPVKNPESKEDLLKIIANVGDALTTPIQKADVKDVFRSSSKTSPHRPIIIDFNSVLLKEKVLQAVKNYNKNHTDKLNTSIINIRGPSQPIFISENLTSKAKRVYYLARDFAKTHAYTYCWTTHGRIYLREKEGTPALRIDSEADLQKLQRNTK